MLSRETETQMEAIERAGRAELTALQEHQLHSQVEKAWATVPFYRRRWEAAGLRLEDIRALDDLRKFPIVTKADFVEDLRQNPPFGSYQGDAIPMRIHASSGITGTPLPVFCTRADCDRIAQLSARRWRAQGMKAGDRVQVTLPYSLYIGGAIAIEGAIYLGATVIPTGTGVMTPTRRQIEIARDWKPTVLCATPSYALRLAEAAREMNLDPARDFHFRLIYVTAEVLTPEMRRKIEQQWNGRVYDNFGSVEAAASTFECRCQRGWHISEDAYIFEVVDAHTGEPSSSGKQGVLVVTSLFREASPFFRYRVGDLVSLLDEPCACGRTFRRMTPMKGRADEMLKLRGISVYPSAVEQVLRTFPELGAEWFLVMEHQGAVQELVVQIEAASPLAEKERQDLESRVADQLKQQIGIRLEVEIFDPGALVSPEAVEGRLKARRVIKRTTRAFLWEV